MIQVYPASSRYSADHGWLQSNFSFSFGDYYDPDNTEFGPLVVFNDDVIAGHRGFGAHPHREMEIVSIVLRGQLQHEDSTGHKAVSGFGAIQRMSAGTGIIHSEVNPGDEEVALLQIWFKPDQRQLPPSYETTSYDPSLMKNSLLPIVSNHSGPNIAHIHQDLTLYLSELEAGQSLDFRQEEGRKIYVFVIEGSVALNGGDILQRRDAARIHGLSKLSLSAEQGATLLIMDLP
ncbi:pirin family protein [Paenibacillus doosanensis]|uniref:Quercetin 2,3-dioxygenase n=1 Tax=Paenibacillus konkukensis TaxID=2020716 RepID=A0ABY4RZA6_9BACL|nr:MULTISPECIES: pirin family protein [Paenibacillus]MCS7459337.1 pirin family protein [Paenibacillus doosanensis]UQZ87130.1 Quercetin 2,3-dioxygenase [Paenibacillus konkukensis]